MTAIRQEKDRLSVGADKPVKPKEYFAGDSLGTSNCTEVDHHSLQDDLTADIFGQQLHGIYVAVAEIKSPGPEKRFRRYYFANLPSAQRRVDKAREDGREAYLYLGQINIIGGDHLV